MKTQALKIAVTVLALAVSVFMVIWLSADTTEEAFEAALLQAPGCTSVSDCDILYTECPLGCSHSVAKHAIPALSALAEELISNQRKDSKACAYDCDSPPPLECRAGRCGFAISTLNQ